MLNKVIKKEKNLTDNETTQLVLEDSVDKARGQEAVASISSDRRAVRILFLTTDQSILEQKITSLDGYLALSDIFDEVHLVVLRTGRIKSDQILRIAENGWLYTVTAKNYHRLFFKGLSFLKEQFSFAEGFRPDVIVARDNDLSGLLAVTIGYEQKRPVQLHITTNQYRQNQKNSFLMKMINKQVWKHLKSVRTDTVDLSLQIKKYFPHIKDVSTLPRFQNPFVNNHNEKPVNILKTKYPQYAFFVVFAGDLDSRSSCYRAIDSMRSILRNPRIVLVVVGDGPLRSECIKRVKLLGVEERVIFEANSELTSSYIASADLLLVTDTTSESENVVTEGMVSGVPLVMAKTPHRTDLFTGNESSLLVEPTDTQGFSNLIANLINDNALRLRVKMSLSALVAERIEQDPGKYRDLYKSSIEEALFADNI